MTSVREIVTYADEFLRVREFQDWPNALNGLQIENSGRVRKIAAAVDASMQTITAATVRGVDLLIVHHGLFWSGLRPVVGPLQRILELAFENDLALYSAHLPLDLHSEIGNNALLARTLGLAETVPFLEMKSVEIGLKCAVEISRDELIARCNHSLGQGVKVFADGPQQIRQIAIITGAAGSEINEVAAAGIHTFITGEAPHWAAIAARDLGMNLLLGGHYSTETFGVKALAAHLSARFDLPWEFLDFPTGL